MSYDTPYRILVAEDDRISRRLLEQTLHNRGYTAVSTENGHEALKAFTAAQTAEADPIDMILLDVMMPGMSGIEVLRSVREQVSPIDLPVIMVTAKGQSTDVVEALESGANDYVTKPIDFEVLLGRMITHLDLKATHEALRSSQLALIHAAKMESVGYLAAGLAHEIRNPIAQIQMSVDALRRNSAKASESDVAKRTKLLDGVEASVQRTDDIVSGLLGYSDTEGLQLSLCNVGKLISESLKLLTQELEDHSVELKFESNSETLDAACSPKEMQRVFVNILLNAIQAMPNGGTLTIRTQNTIAPSQERSEGSRSAAAIQPGAPGTLIEIVDSGPGVSEIELPRMFDPFYTSKPTGSGTGLGLTVAHKLVELQGGNIELSNCQEHSGLSVRILLPQKAPEFI